MSDEFLYLRAAAALIFVLALLGGVALVARRFSGGMVPSRRQKRLSVLEVAAVDPKRRLVLIKRDQVEHLLLIGGGQDLVIESGIGSALPEAIAPVAEDLPPARPGPPRSRLDEVRF